MDWADRWAWMAGDGRDGWEDPIDWTDRWIDGSMDPMDVDGLEAILG